MSLNNIKGNQYSHRHRCHIRETLRFVGDFSFYCNRVITSVVFQSSVESIGWSSFSCSSNLRYIHFKKNCKLRIIWNYSFCCTSLESIDIPSNVEDICAKAFNACSKLKSVTFQGDSKLRIIWVFLWFCHRIHWNSIKSWRNRILCILQIRKFDYQLLVNSISFSLNFVSAQNMPFWKMKSQYPDGKVDNY